MRIPQPAVLVMVGLIASATAAGAAVEAIQEVLVTGEHPGPALWKVTSGQHLLWILAEPPTPLPMKFVWRSKRVAAAIATAQELILDGGITFDSSRLGKPLTIFAYHDMRTLPAGQSLADVVPENLYRRFRVLKDTFAANDAQIERLRPWAAGIELRKHVMKSLSLTNTSVSGTVLAHAWRAKVISLFIYADYAEFERNSKSNRTMSCLEDIVSELETDRNDLQRLANAWSVGDIEALRELVLRQKPDQCQPDMFDNDQRAKEASARHTEQWLAAVDLALQTYQTAFAIVPTDRLFAPDGWLTALRARGYEVQEPQ
ncbi:MAG: TraB/GumN family protein [Steroidobacteraceae bacterium]